MENNDKEGRISGQEKPENPHVLDPGPDGRIHPAKVWQELREMECSDGKKRTRWVTICQF